ncbi:MAG: hypothetical protein ACYTGN_08535 [Planctomycetota bacterium]|jgi:membrane-associated protease RseP (regulator of RpoE activity)
MHRILIIVVTALLMSPAGAQDEEKGNVDKLRAEEREIVELVLRMRSSDPQTSADARRKLMALLPKASFDLTFGEDALVLLDPKGPSESIRGTSTDKNGKVDYTLKRLGGGKYELRARRTQGVVGVTGLDKLETKVLEEIKDEGTMAELAKRHAFLHGAPMRGGVGFGGLVVQTSRGPHGARVLGAFATRPSEDLAYHLFLPKGVGYVVRHVAKGSRAEKLGLKPFDVITKVDGKWIEDPKQLERAKSLEYFRRATAAQVDLGS